MMFPVLPLNVIVPLFEPTQARAVDGERVPPAGDGLTVIVTDAVLEHVPLDPVTV